MKQISVESNWLNDIAGMKVADAIEYLRRLPQDHRLAWCLEGDTHGCQMECELILERPYTEQELAAESAQRKAKQVASWERSVEYYSRKVEKYKAANLPGWVESNLKLLEHAKAKLEELKSRSNPPSPPKPSSEVS